MPTAGQVCSTETHGHCDQVHVTHVQEREWLLEVCAFKIVVQHDAARGAEGDACHQLHNVQLCVLGNWPRTLAACNGWWQHGQLYVSQHWVPGAQHMQSSASVAVAGFLTQHTCHSGPLPVPCML